MNTNSLLILLLIGAVAGWLAGKIMRGGGLIGSIVTATVGAMVLLFLIRLIKRAEIVIVPTLQRHC